MPFRKITIQSLLALTASYVGAEAIVINDTIADIEVRYYEFWNGDFTMTSGRFAYNNNWAIDTNGVVSGCTLVTKEFPFFGSQQTNHGVIRPKIKFVDLKWSGYWQNYLEVPMMAVRLQYDNQVGDTVQVYHWVPIKQHLTYLNSTGNQWEATGLPGLLMELPETKFNGEISNVSVGLCNLIGGLSMTIDDVRINFKDGN